MPPSVPQIIENFHLAFLAVLPTTKLDRSRYVLKGGANLRYFFDSVRYSEDIDLDVVGDADFSFEEQVDMALSSDALSRLLRASGITVPPDLIKKPKQTEATRRWKVALNAPGQSEPVRTKIEFSNRNGDDRFELAAVHNAIVSSYGLTPPALQHYLIEAAEEQKVVALAKRPETQARDVFDLDLLFRKEPLGKGAIDEGLRKSAAEAAVALPFAAFQDTVLPFLEQEVAALYGQSEWEAMQDHVAGELLR